MFTVGKLRCYCGPVLGGPEDFWQTTLHVPIGRQAIRKEKTRVSFLALILGLASEALGHKFYFLFICFSSPSFVLG